MANRDVIEIRRQRDSEFVDLLTRYKGPLFRFVFSLVHSMPDAEDVFQQTAITLWDKFDDYEPGTDFFAWACSIARYKAMNYFQSKGRERLHFSEVLINQLATHDKWQTDMHDARLKALAACRRKLSERDQQLLADCYSGQGTIAEVSKRLGRPVGSVYDSLSRIRRLLYACIKRTLANEGRI